jgi:phosphate starvation-inducible membrane PsiE
MVKQVMGTTERKPIPKLFLTDHKRHTVVNARLNITTFDKLINGDVQGSTGQVVENYLFFVCYLKLYLMFVKYFRSDVRTDFLVYHILMEHVTKLFLPIVIVYGL